MQRDTKQEVGLYKMSMHAHVQMHVLLHKHQPDDLGCGRCRHMYKCLFCCTSTSLMILVVAGAGISEKVGTKPVGVEVLGMKLVLFRGSDGTVHCLHGTPSSALVHPLLHCACPASMRIVGGCDYVERVSTRQML